MIYSCYNVWDGREGRDAVGVAQWSNYTMLTKGARTNWGIGGTNARTRAREYVPCGWI